MEWQPIETAPKDETHIWLYEGDTTKKQWRGYFDGKWWVCGASSDDHTVAWMMRIHPTHWMPLPKAPEQVMWIACKDKMPESGKAVLVDCPRYSKTAIVGTWWNSEQGSGGEHWGIDFEWHARDEVLHWCELPSLPSQEK